MSGWRPAVTLLLRLAVLAVTLGGLAWVFSAERAGNVRLALGMLGFLVAFVALAVTALVFAAPQYLGLGEPLSSAQKATAGEIAFWIGVALLLATGIPRFAHLASRIPSQTVVACRIGPTPDGSPAAALSGGGVMDLGAILGPKEGCPPAGTTFEKRRWEDAYLVGGTHRWASGPLQTGSKALPVLGLVLFGVGVYLRTKVWRAG